MDIMDKVNKEQCKKNIPNFNVGDTIRLHFRITEGKTERIQAFTGIVIAKRGKDIQETVTVRRLAYGQGIEKVVPLHSPRLSKIEIVKRGEVKRSKLYYLRNRIGKAARVREKRVK